MKINVSEFLKGGFTFTLLSLQLAFVTPGYSQEVWPLRKCIETALNNNLTIKSSKLNLESAGIDATQARHARYPNLSASSSVFWNFGRTIDPTSNTFTTETFFNNRWGLNTGVTLFNGFAIKNSILQTKENINAAKEDIEQTRNDIALNVSSFYLNALFAKENLAIAKSNLELTRASLNQIQTLVRSGARAPNEALDIEAQFATDEQALLIAENNFTVSKMQLRQLMLTDQDFDVELPGSIALSTDPDIIIFEELYEGALSTQRAVAAGEYRVRSADLGVKIAKGQRLPSLTVGGSLGTNYSNQGIRFAGSEKVTTPLTAYLAGVPYNFLIEQETPLIERAGYAYQVDNNLSYGIGMSLSIPILNNYANTANIEKAKIFSETTRINLETTKQNLKITVQQAHADAKAAKLKLQAAEKTFTAQQAAYDNAGKRFSLGSISSLDLSNARTRLDNARNNLLISKYDHIFRVKILDYYLGKGISL
ncbi:MAG: TolC family protein [Saprospiraceae bacterium]|nr:TolC family protein [Saprospiraceae bacterium]